MSGGCAIAHGFGEFGNPDRLAVVQPAMEDLAFPLDPPHLQPEPPYEVRRFSSDGTVVVRGATASVFIGGLLIGTFDENADDRGPRNVLVVTLSKWVRLFHSTSRREEFRSLDEPEVRPLERKRVGNLAGVA
jgi:hypothetical protein